jgi:hypothetical protein
MRRGLIGVNSKVIQDKIEGDGLEPMSFHLGNLILLSLKKDLPLLL